MTAARHGAQVSVDPELCVGTGDCARSAPDAFRVDEAQGVSVVLEGARDTDLARLLEAAENCPTQAIRVVSGDTVLHESG